MTEEEIALIEKSKSKVIIVEQVADMVSFFILFA